MTISTLCGTELVDGRRGEIGVGGGGGRTGCLSAIRGEERSSTGATLLSTKGAAVVRNFLLILRRRFG